MAPFLYLDVQHTTPYANARKNTSSQNVYVLLRQRQNDEILARRDCIPLERGRFVPE